MHGTERPLQQDWQHSSMRWFLDRRTENLKLQLINPKLTQDGRRAVLVLAVLAKQLEPF